MIKRTYPIALICFLSIPLLFAQNSQSNNAAANIGGAWQITWQGRGGSQQATIQIQQDGSTLSGTFQDSQGGSSQLSGSVQGNNVSFSVQIQGRPMTLAFTGTISGDKMSGTFQPQGGGRGGRGGGGGQGNQNHSWTGVRQQSGQSEPQRDQDEDDEYGV